MTDSEVDVIDLTRVIVDVAMQEAAYQVAFATTGRVLQASLVDFLR